MAELNQYPIDPYSLVKRFASYNPEEEARKEFIIKNCPHIEYEQDMGANIPFCQIDGNMCNGQCLKTPQRAVEAPPHGRLVNDSWRRKGKNIATDYDEVDQFVCSECGIELQNWVRVERDEDDGDETHYEYRFNFCPNCGADMRGE